MKKLIIALLFALPGLSMAAAPGVPLEKAGIDLRDQSSLQRGAQLFVNYCMGCHSVQYQRYNRMGRDIGLSDDQVRDNLMFVGDRIGDTMTIAMPKADAASWFGTPPPDLSVVSRSRGVDWLYSYLKGFYIDESRPFGMNNAVFPDVGMPHALWELEGLKRGITETVIDADGNESSKVVGYEMVKPGKLSAVEYDQAARDLTNFLAYTGEPVKLQRQQLGIWVLLFLGVLFIFAYLLKKEYWRDIH
ncbi:MAG: cytochrome c1 [Chromatiales bacterium]|nr:cytochrome c1 [Gammaproteobacteria bacterium]MBW6476237.1 cytochrome c1 [Chromatiales bacterium]